MWHLGQRSWHSATRLPPQCALACLAGPPPHRRHQCKSHGHFRPVAMPPSFSKPPPSCWKTAPYFAQDPLRLLLLFWAL